MADSDERVSLNRRENPLSCLQTARNNVTRRPVTPVKSYLFLDGFFTDSTARIGRPGGNARALDSGC